MYIRFGTDGWRGVIADDFTFENVARVGDGAARYLGTEESSCGPVVIGYDRRFLSNRFADCLAEVLTAYNIKVELAKEPLPTPALAFWVHYRKAPLGLMVTASHNPPQFNGVKIKTTAGCSAPKELTERIERYVNSYQGPISRRSLQEAEAKGLLNRCDPSGQYARQLLNLVDVEAIRKAKLKVVADSMHGSAGTYLPAILERAGIEVVPMRHEENPGFGGVNPEPIEANLEALRHRVQEVGAHLGIAVDGDGDRVGAVAPDGSFVNPHQIFALLLRHLVENQGKRGEVVRTVSTTQMIDHLCRHYNLKLHEVPIGFKHIAALMLERDVLIGGEESGGIGIRGHLPERDGTLSALLLLEMMAKTGKGIMELRSDLFDLVGEHQYGRIDLHFTGSEGREAVAEITEKPPAQIGDRKVCDTNNRDGIKLFFQGGGWLMLRASGTEPVVRIYAEAASKDAVSQLLSEGERLLHKTIKQLERPLVVA